MEIYIPEFGGWLEVLKQIYSNFKRITSINVKGKHYDIYQDVISKKYIAVIIY